MHPVPTYAIVVAGGAGLRAGGDIPKQFRLLDGKPVFLHTLLRFRQANPDTRLILVMNADFMPLYEELRRKFEDEFPEVTVTVGGATRWQSVRNGLALIPDDENDALVAVHDAARPLVTTQMILDGFRTADEAGAAIPVIPLSDSIRRLTAEGSQAADRSQFMAVQTPQCFRCGILKRAYEAPFSPLFTDDASVVEAAGWTVEHYHGDPRNMKITNPADFAIATALLKLTN